MEDLSLCDFFIDKDYKEEQFSYKGIEQKLLCSKASSTDYDLTGLIIWKAAKQLSEYIVENQDIFKDKTVLELGAGAGLSGLVCSQFAKEVYLTDGNELIVDLLKKNQAYAIKKNVFVEKLQWGKEGDEQFLNQLNDTFKFDIIIGADILFWPQSIDPLSQTLDTFFKLNEKLQVYIATRVRSLNVESQFNQNLIDKNMKRITLFNEGENYFYKVVKL